MNDDYINKWMFILTLNSSFNRSVFFLVVTLFRSYTAQNSLNQCYQVNDLNAIFCASMLMFEPIHPHREKQACRFLGIREFWNYRHV